MLIFSAADVQDGLANTYMVGEKYLQPELYFNGQDLGDNGRRISATTRTSLASPTSSPCGTAAA